MSIQAAINAANPGERIEIRAGTYPEFLTMNKSLTIVGAGSDQVTIDASATTGVHFSIYDASDVTLEGFTLMGAGADSGSSYGLKVSGVDAATKAQNLSVTDVVVKDTGSTGVDINGVDGVTLTGITVTDTGGAGITLTDVDHAMLSQVSTSGNDWGIGLNISTYGKYYPGGSDGITVEAGTVQLSEIMPIKTEIDNDADPANPYPIVNFDPGDYRYAIHNDTVDPNSVVYMSDMDAAVNSASLVPDSYIIHYVSGLVNPTSGSEDRYFLVGDGVVGVMSIQVAIDAANPGEDVKVLTGVYEESPIVNKPLTLERYSDTDVPEVHGNITVDASQVIVHGFDISNPDQTTGMLVKAGHADITITSNTIHDIGGAGMTTHVKGIVLSNGPDNVTIADNTFSNINSGSNNASGIYAGDTASADATAGLDIHDNSFADINAGKGAYGVLVNNAAGITDMAVENNTFSNLSGDWSHAVGLEGPTPDAVVRNNEFSDITVLSGTWPLTNNVAVYFEANPVGDSVEVAYNQFNGLDFFGVVVAPIDVIQHGYTVMAEKNWWDSPCGPSVFADGDGAGVGPNVDYDPWLHSPDGTAGDPSPLFISLPDATTAHLTWKGSDTLTYNIYRDVTPYFTPTSAYDTATGSTYDDAGAVGDPAENHYYMVALACPSGEAGSDMTNQVAEFDFTLVPGQ